MDKIYHIDEPSDIAPLQRFHLSKTHNDGRGRSSTITLTKFSTRGSLQDIPIDELPMQPSLQRFTLADGSFPSFLEITNVNNADNEDKFAKYQTPSSPTDVTKVTAAQAPTDQLVPILRAAVLGDHAGLKALLNVQGTNLLRRDPKYGQSALHLAIRGGYDKVVEVLLNPEIAASIVNAPDNQFNTALHIAVVKSKKITQLLLDAKANVHFKNARGQTALGIHLLTLTKDKPEITELLLKAGANPNALVDHTPILHLMLNKKLYRIANLLVEHGAQLNTKDCDGKLVVDKIGRYGIYQALLANVKTPPFLLPDEEQPTCMNNYCNKLFTSFGNRRHHCRLCGLLYCNACTVARVSGKYFPFVPRESTHKPRDAAARKCYRTCDMCYQILQRPLYTSTSQDYILVRKGWE